MAAIQGMVGVLLVDGSSCASALHLTVCSGSAGGPKPAYVDKALLQSCQLPGALPDSPPITLLRVQAPGKVLLVEHELHSKAVAPLGISHATFKRRVHRAPSCRGKLYRRPAPSLRAEMIAMGFINVKASHVNLITLAVAKEACQSLRLPAPFLAALASLHDPALLIIPVPTADLLRQNAPLSLNPTGVLVINRELPSCLDPTPPLLQHRERYSMTQHATLARTQLLQTQMGEFHMWCTRAFQAGRSSDAVQGITWEGIHKEVMLFLGFAHYKKGWVQPGLAAACDAALISTYISSRKESGHGYSTLCKSFMCLDKVLEWWQGKHGTSVDDVAAVAALRTWLSGMRVQLSKVMPRLGRDPVTLREQGKWMDAWEVVALFEKHRLWAMNSHGAGAGPLALDVARRIHDVALCCCMFGWMPPLRVSCIRSMMIPSYSGLCRVEGCLAAFPACTGNRLSYRDGHLQFFLPHHKNSRRWGRAVIQFDVPDGLLQLLQLYLSRARPVLAAALDVSLPNMFISTTGKAFSAPLFCQYFQSVMCKMQAAPIAPKDLRQIFVTERCSRNSAPGPHRSGAAMVMGHSERQWDESYNLEFGRSLAQQAVACMPEWRMHALARAAAPALGAVAWDAGASTLVPVAGRVGVHEDEEDDDDSVCDEPEERGPSPRGRRGPLVLASSSDEEGVEVELA